MLYKKFSEIITKNKLFSTHDKILLGVSGGSDSIALLHLFLKLTKDMNLYLSIAHLNHGIRGFRATQDEKFVAALAKKYHLPYFSREVDVPNNAKANRLSLEDAARQARLIFFQDLCLQNGFTKVCLAHTSDDQMETIIMNFLRGSGLKGLTGMPLKRSLLARVELVRPLLSFSKKELRAFCQKQGIKWREDHTNKQIDQTRNKIRNIILPKLGKINPSLENTLAKMAEVVKEENQYLEEIASKILQEIIQKQTANGIRLDTKKLLTYHAALQRRVVRLAIEQVQGHLQDVYL
ncbi:MAG: tRNA lysidine(34) synthetase TilS, partial [Candidatus Margulisbacteria bacterium]|nr:tRNA lysidine(34) synthetase TilS [Candidatus Margulisiibacteriota bacterium]